MVRAQDRGTLSDRRPGRAPLSVCAVAATGMVMAGCMGAPTYGTGTPADKQLLEDISESLTLAPEKKAPIAYSPRPEIVMPPSTAVLPSPQEGIATADNPAWPESPEQRLARIRAEATENQSDPTYSAGVVRDVDTGPKEVNPVIRTPGTDMRLDNREQSPRDTRKAFNERLAMTRQGSPGSRRYLSEPPLDYRVPAESAPAGDVGVEEWKKERDAKKAARKEKPFWRGRLPGT